MQAVARAELFEGLANPHLQTLMATATLVHSPEAGLLFSQGDPAEAFFVVLEGMVSLSIYHADGSQAVVETVHPVRTFAEAAALLLGTYPVTGEYAAGTMLVRFPVRQLMALLAGSSELASGFLASLARREQELSRQINQLKLHTPAERLVSLLMNLAAPQTEGEATLTLPYEKAMVAKVLGITPESLSRLFGRLDGRGISTMGRRVHIRDLGALRDFCRDSGPRGC
ncbi:Crp/Fnr family transcriptional regulator [Magnetospira thiophila]